MTNRERILVLTPFSFIPPKDGGHERCFHLYTGLPEKFDIIILSLTWSGNFSVTEIHAHVTYITVPVSISARLSAESMVDFLESKSWDLLIGLCFSKLTSVSELVQWLQANSLITILGHPWMFPLINRDLPFLVDCHNSESRYFENTFSSHSLDFKLSRMIERAALQNCAGFSACSLEDVEDLRIRYSLTQPSSVIPNGVSISKRRESISSSSHNTILFLGSGHFPNVVAARRVIRIAKLLPKYEFRIIGSASLSLKDDLRTENVYLEGYLPTEALDALAAKARAMIIPMETGSGTHLKLLRAQELGLPVITTSVGARGFQGFEKSYLLAESDEDFVLAILKLENEKVRQNLINQGHLCALAHDWKSIQNKFAHFSEEIGISKVQTSKSVSLQDINNFFIIKEKSERNSIDNRFRKFFDTVKVFLPRSVKHIAKQFLRKFLRAFAHRHKMRNRTSLAIALKSLERHLG